LDAAIKYVKNSQGKADPFEIVPISEQVDIAETIKNPDTCDICWGTEGLVQQLPRTRRMRAYIQHLPA
jgi:hypothetical protein